MGNECSRIPSVRMAPTERFWCAEHSGYPELYKEDICICLCRVYVISYRVCPLRFARRHSFGVALRPRSGNPLRRREPHSLSATDITKLSVSLHRIQFRAGRGLAVTDWRVFVIRPGRPQCYLSPGPDPSFRECSAPKAAALSTLRLRPDNAPSTNTGFFGTAPCVGLWFTAPEFIYLATKQPPPLLYSNSSATSSPARTGLKKLAERRVFTARQKIWTTRQTLV